MPQLHVLRLILQLLDPRLSFKKGVCMTLNPKPYYRVFIVLSWALTRFGFKVLVSHFPIVREPDYILGDH